MKFPETKPAPPPKWMRIPVKFAIPEDILKENLNYDIFKEQWNHIQTKQIVKTNDLNTVCEEASCPNLHHCWGLGTATFLIMGDRCTRRCGFCDIDTAKPFPLDPTEPYRLAIAVKKMQLKHVVITSVDRDDLKDGGSLHFAQCIIEVKKQNPKTTIEVLIPDFKGKDELLNYVFDAKPEIINHNIETVPSLYKSICPQSNYQISLKVLELSSKNGFLTKTGLIVGLGETIEELKEVIKDAKNAGTHILTIGQYLQPTRKHAPLKKYYSLQEFEELKNFAYQLGYIHIEAGPNVRSSFHAGIGIDRIIQNFYQNNKKK
ncbi:MAG: lipoyl synthase [Leptospiraceae bacterium]|nr:MAG: lipoyl synthase [Leptospiraceae bacterium]